MMILLALAAALGSSGGSSTTKVKVEGQTYRVTIHGDRVEIANKSIIVAREPLKERDARRRAVVQATGCTLRDEMKQGSVLLGRLDCQKEVANGQ